MKTLQIFLIAGALLSGFSQEAFAQDPQTSNYVVIGAFSKIENALRFTNAANQDNFQAEYAINPQRQLYYVFILNSPDVKKAFSFLSRIRVETKYKDAWVYRGILGEGPVTVAKETKTSPIVEEKPVEPTVVVPIVEEIPKKDSVIIQPVVSIDSSSFKPVVEIEEKKPAGKPFFFKLVNAASGNDVMGEVQVVESKATQYQGFKGNEIVYLLPPKNNTGVYQITIQAPGYKQAKLALNYQDPSGVSSGLGDKQEAIITFNLERAKKGDYIDFISVRFFRNTSILEPTSQNELDGFAALMKENPKYEVKIHGHCNGEEPRDIITLGSSTNIFELEPSQNAKETATSKRLTELRAEAVKNYIVSQGIEQNRISTKGEGGKMMIYPPTSTLANYNDRIEIEILKGK